LSDNDCPTTTFPRAELSGNNCRLLNVDFLIQVDWYRNAQAAGGCEIIWRRQTHTITTVEPLNRQTALPTFPLLLRTVLRLLGTQHFVSMT
jgi:hypothetical protein